MSTKFQEIQEYYGKRLQQSDDLQTNACCTSVQPKKYIRQAIAQVHDEVKNRYYGCGLTIPEEVSGMHILDLGSGSGRDCYIASQLVGSSGSVTGIDMTKEQLAIANQYIDYHTEKFGYSNVRFVEGNIQELDQLGLKDEQYDIIISNCVINLVEDKQKVLNEAYRLLKPGGELYFSDVYCDRRIPKELQDDQVLWGECLSGALYWNDFLNYAKNAGFTDPRSMESSPITINNPIVEDQVGDLRFYSVTYRLWKIEGLESDCEDYGQAIRYKGSIEESQKGMYLDDHHYFPKGKIVSVCGNTYKMLHDTRFKEHFDFFGDFSTHYGIFEGCGGAMPFSSSDKEDSASNCC